MPITNDVFSYTSGSAPGPASTAISSTKATTRDDDVKNALNTTTSLGRGGHGGTTAVQGSDNLSTVSSTIASATTTDLSAATGVHVTISGTTTITGLGTEQAGAIRYLTFSGILTLTHNATSLILPSAANITTAVNDTATLKSLGSGNWHCIKYSRADGTAIVGTSVSSLSSDLDANGNMIKWSKGADIASATALPVLTDGNYFDVTGTTTVTSFATAGGDGTIAPVIKLHFDGALTLTHHATNLILPGGANITTAAGDEAEFVEYAAADWRCTNYSKADGRSNVIIGVPDAVMEDQKTAGTRGGTSTVSWQQRDINTETRDPDGLISISLNQFTPTVAGWVEWSAPVYNAGAHRTRLYNVTDSAVAIDGSSERTGTTSQTRSIGSGPVLAGKTYKLEHYTGTATSTNGLGNALGSGAEIYTIIKFWRT